MSIDENIIDSALSSYKNNPIFEILFAMPCLNWFTCI